MTLIRYYRLLAVASVLVLSACTTVKYVKTSEDINDDGKSNIAVFTYDLDVYAAEKYPTVNRTQLEFKCQENKSGGDCFSVVLPYVGPKDTDGATQHFFERSGANVFRFKYGEYNVDSVKHKVLVSKVPRQQCSYNKKTKKRECRTVMDEEKTHYGSAFPVPVSFSVSPGSGCYLGHFKISLNNFSMSNFEHSKSMEELTGNSAELPEDIKARVLEYVDGPC